MKKIFLIVSMSFISIPFFSQTCEKGCGKVTKVEPTTLKGVKPDRALLIFKFTGPTGKPAKTNVKIIIDKDTIVPAIDKTGMTKMTARQGAHKLKFKAPYWYAVNMDINLKVKNTYSISVKFEAEEVIGGTRPNGK